MLFYKQDVVSKPYRMDQYDLNKSIICCTSVADDKNHSISGAQKELLYWNQRLCLNIQYLQHLMKPHNVRYQEGNIITERPFTIPIIYKYTANLSRDQYSMCLACKLAT